MAGAGSLWRSLRPTLLAGAAALTWLTVSSTAASADTLPESSPSLLGSVTSSVSSVAEALPVLPAGDLGHTSASPDGLLQSATGPLAGAVDTLIASVPVVHHVVPANAVSAVTAPATAAADDVVAGAVEAVVAPLTEAVPVLEPAVQPITDLVSGDSPLHGGLPALPQLPATSAVEAVPGDTGVSEGGTAPFQADLAAVATESIEVSGGSLTALTPASIAAAPVTTQASLASYPSSGGSPTALIGEQTVPSGGSPYPAHVPAPPASNNGGSTASGAGSGPAAWLAAFDLPLPLAGNSPLGEYSERAPSPVSYDPGSSPD